MANEKTPNRDYEGNNSFTSKLSAAFSHAGTELSI
jgi:hypothetical protein